MKAFSVLPFLFLLFGSSQESALSHKRSIRGLNTTLQTNFNGTFQIKNPCTNADVETSSYVASHEFHHHIKEDNWSDYLQKCSAIISGFLRGIGNLVRSNSKQNTAFNFHVNTSISQKQDVGHCAKQCDSLPTIVIQAESCELPPPCEIPPKVHNKCLPKQDERQNSKNYLTAQDTIKQGYEIEEQRQKDQELIYDGSDENTTPFSGFSTSSAQTGIEETSDFSQNQQTICTSELPETSERDFTASIAIQPEDEFTTPMTPTPSLDYSEGSLFTNPEAQDYSYSTPTIPEYQTAPPPSFNDEKIINNQYRVMEIPEQTPPSGFERESVGVEKPFKYQQAIPLGLGEREYVEGMIPPSERFQPADLKTKPNPQILDKFPLQQQAQPIDDMYINTTPFVDQQNEEIIEGSSTAYPSQPETSYPTPPVDYLTTPPPSQILPPSIPENEFHPPPLTNKFSETKTQTITEVYTSETKKPFIPRENFPGELPKTTPNYPDLEETINDFYTPVISEFRKNDKLGNIYTTILPPESVTIYDSDEDVLNDKQISPRPDEEFYIKNQTPPPSFPKRQPFLNEKTTSPAPADDPKNPDFEFFIPTSRKQSSKAQPEYESLTIPQPSLVYPGIEETRVSNSENPIQPPKTFVPITAPDASVTSPKGDFYPSNSLGNSPLPASDPIIYAPSRAPPVVTQPEFSHFENPSQPPIGTFEPPTTPLPPVTYPENNLYSSDYPSTVENTPSSAFEPMAYSQASTDVEEPGFSNFENPTQPPIKSFKPITTPLPPVAYPEGDFYPSDNGPPSGNSPAFNEPQTPPEAFKPNNYVEASSQAFAEVQETRIPNFENRDQPPGPNFEPITTNLPPVTYPEGFNRPQTPLEALKPINYAEVSSQASAEVQEIGTPNFKNHDQPPRTNFELITTPLPPVNYPEDDFYPSDNQPTPVFNEPQIPLEVFKPNNYVEASSQASAEVRDIPKLKNLREPLIQSLEPPTTPPPSVTYPEGDFYPSDYPPTLENTSAFGEPQTKTEAFEPTTYAKASSQASIEVEEPRLSNFKPPRPTSAPTAYSEASSTAFAEVEEPATSNFNNLEHAKPAFIQTITPNSEDYPTTQSEPIIPNDYNRPPPTDLTSEADLPFWAKRPIEPQPLPVRTEDVAIASSNSQSNLQSLNQFATPQPQPPLDYYDEKIPERYSQKPLVSLDTTSIPQPQPEEITTPPSYQDYTPGEEPFVGDSTPPAVKSQEKIPIYSPPFELEPQPQPQPQPSDYISGDNILASKTFENSKTTNQYSETSFENSDTQDRTTFSTDFVTTSKPLPDIPSFQTPPRSKPEDLITNYQQNIGAQETLLFDDNVSPQPQPTTAVKTYKEIVTTEYQTSPAPSPQPQMTMNYANQHSDDNPTGKIPELFTNQQQLVTPEPDFDSSTSAVASESFSQSEQVINSENQKQTTANPIEEVPQPPVNYPNPKLYLPYNNQLRSQPIHVQPPPRQQSLKNLPPSENVNQFKPPVMASPMQPSNNVWMSRPNEQVPFHPNDNFRPPVPNLQAPPGRFLYPRQNFNPRELYFPQGLPGGFPRPAPNFPPFYEPRRPFNPDFQNAPRVPITDSRTNTYDRPPSLDSSNSVIRETKVVEETITTDVPTAIAESPIEKQLEYTEKRLNNKRIPEPIRDDRRFELSENYRPLNREFGPRNFPQQVEPFYGGFPPNASHPNYGQMRPRNGFPVPGPGYPEYDQVFPNSPPRPQFARDEIIPQSMSNMQFDQRVPGVIENQYYPERPQRPLNYLPDRELFEKQQHPNPLFHALENHMKIPLQEPSSPEMPNESERNYFHDDSPGWERPNPPPSLPESQLVSDLTNPSNNPDRTANGRFNYMDRPLRKPYNEDRMRPVATPERF